MFLQVFDSLFETALTPSQFRNMQTRCNRGGRRCCGLRFGDYDRVSRFQFSQPIESSFNQRAVLSLKMGELIQPSQRIDNSSEPAHGSPRAREFFASVIGIVSPMC